MYCLKTQILVKITVLRSRWSIQKRTGSPVRPSRFWKPGSSILPTAFWGRFRSWRRIGM